MSNSQYTVTIMAELHWEGKHTDGKKLEMSANHNCEQAGTYNVLVKVIDILGDEFNHPLPPPKLGGGNIFQIPPSYN